MDKNTCDYVNGTANRLADDDVRQKNVTVMFSDVHYNLHTLYMFITI